MSTSAETSDPLSSKRCEYCRLETLKETSSASGSINLASRSLGVTNPPSMAVTFVNMPSNSANSRVWDNFRSASDTLICLRSSAVVACSSLVSAWARALFFVNTACNAVERVISALSRSVLVPTPLSKRVTLLSYALCLKFTCSSAATRSSLARSSNLSASANPTLASFMSAMAKSRADFASEGSISKINSPSATLPPSTKFGDNPTIVPPMGARTSSVWVLTISPKVLITG